MDAIILAGGLGTRLLPVVSDVPKPLAPVNGRPFLDIILDQLNGFESVSNVVLAIGHKSNLITEQYGGPQRFRFSLDFSVETSPLGTGGAIARAIAQTSSKDVLVLNGDSYVQVDVEQLLRRHHATSAVITIVVMEQSDTARYGTVRFQTESLKVLEFIEKNASGGAGFINAGCYVIARAAFEGLAESYSSFEKDLLPQHLAETYAFVTQGKFIDIGVPESYYAASGYLA